MSERGRTKMQRKLPRLAIVISHPVQYWVPVYRDLAASDVVDLKVFFVAENGAYEYYDAEFDRLVKWDIPLTEGYDYEVLNPGLILKDYRFFSVDAKSVIPALNEFNPDFVMINGYAQRVNWRVAFGLPKPAQLLYTSDSNLDNKRNWWRALVKQWVVGLFFKRPDVFFSCGPKNKAYLLRYGVLPEAIVESTLPVDSQRLVEQCRTLEVDAKKKVRRDLDIATDEFVLLFVGKLVSHKRPQDVIDAVAQARAKSLPVSAIILGSGTMMHELQHRARELNVDGVIKFVGFVNQSQMGPYFAASDALVFSSSREGFGLVASEALPFGLPILASDGVGAVGASVVHGKNALVYPCGDVARLTGSIQSLLQDSQLKRRLSRASLTMSKDFDKTVVVNNILAVCNRKKGKTIDREHL